MELNQCGPDAQVVNCSLFGLGTLSERMWQSQEGAEAQLTSATM